jgi:hypothetical protein
VFAPTSIEFFTGFLLAQCYVLHRKTGICFLVRLFFLCDMAIPSKLARLWSILKIYQLRYNLYLAQPNYNKEIMGGEKIVLPRTLSLPINVAILWKNLIQIIYNKGF